MKIRAISLNNVRKFVEPVRIGAIGDGLNVLSEPNEHGKSTLFDAIQALFFVAHGSKGKEVAALRPHAGGAPEVTVEVETEAGQFAVSKRWLSKPAATVTQNGRLIAQADAAETWIGRLLGGGDGPSGLLWVRQGVSGLADGSNKEIAASMSARRDLLSTVTEEVEAMTGGRRMDRALKRCREALELYTTKTGTAKKGGPWKESQDKVAALIARRDAFVGTAEALHDALAQRKRHRRTLTDLESPEAVTARKLRLDAATAAHRDAERHAEDVANAQREMERAALVLSNVRSQRETAQAVRTEQAQAAAAAEATATKSVAAQVAADTALAGLTKAQDQLTVCQSKYAVAESARRAAQTRQAAQNGAARRTDLIDRIARADTARQHMENAAAQAKSGPDTATLRKLEQLAADLANAQAMQAATATQAVMTYMQDAQGQVTSNGEVIAAGQALALTGVTRFDIAGIGTLEVRPGTGGQDDGRLARCEAALRSGLDDIGAADLRAAQTLAEARIDAERRYGEAKAARDSHAPDGIGKLREFLAAIPVIEESSDGPTLDEAEAALLQAEEARLSAQTERDIASERLSDARMLAARTGAEATGAQTRLDRAHDAAARLGSLSEESLLETQTSATTALESAQKQLTDKQTNAPDLAATLASLTRAKSVEDEARAEINRLRPAIATLDERIARSSGDAVEERLAETEQELQIAEADLARIEREIAVLRRLEAALDAAQTDARDRYFAPVAAELKPLLHLLWPDAELTWGHDTLLPEALIRNGQHEPIEILSGGTQEQIALLVRLAFARMLAKTGRHAPVILDDALVFTDDDRIERMFDALHRQAGDLQIIVLSCRQRAFRALGGHSLHLTAEETAA